MNNKTGADMKIEVVKLYKPVSLFLFFLILAAAIHTNAVQSADEAISKAAVLIRQPWLNEVMTG